MATGQYTCSDDITEAKPSSAHYQWHRNHREVAGPPCPLAVEEKRLDNARLYRRRNPNPKPRGGRRLVFVCGTLPPHKPGDTHWRHDREDGEPCDTALMARSWNGANKRTGREMTWGEYVAYKDAVRAKRKEWRVEYACGTEAEAGEPNSAHVMRDLRRYGKTCGAARRERLLYDRQLTGRDEAFRHDHRCGSREDAVKGSLAHYSWHKNVAFTSLCERALEEARLYRLSYRPDRPRRPAGWDDRPTSVYQHRFLDGDSYTGIAFDTEVRWRLERSSNSVVGEKMRSGVGYVSEVLYVAPDRRWAQLIEKGVIEAGNPFGRVLNIQHSQPVLS